MARDGAPRILRPVAAPHRPLPKDVSFPKLEEEVLQRSMPPC